MAKAIRRGWMAPAAWDVVEGKRMYEAGVKCPKIAEKLGTTAAAVRAYAHRHWIAPVEAPEVQKVKPKAKPEPEQERVRISRITGLPALGPCDKDCDTCAYVFRSHSGCMPMCDYYLQTGKHRHPDEDGKCAVKVATDGKKYAAYHEGLERQKARRAESRKKRKPVPVAWDTEKALELWKEGLMYKEISAVVGSSPSNICIYAGKNWGEFKPLRDAAIEKMGGPYVKDRR